MWCDRCQSESPTEAIASSGGLRCRRCGSIVHDAQKSGDAIRQARAILERWQSSDILDRIRTTEEIPPLVWSSGSERRVTELPVPQPIVPQAPPRDAADQAELKASVPDSQNTIPPAEELKSPPDIASDPPDARITDTPLTDLSEDSSPASDVPASSQLESVHPPDAESGDAAGPEVTHAAPPESPPRFVPFFGVTQVMAAPAVQIAGVAAPQQTESPNSAVPTATAIRNTPPTAERQPVRRPPSKRRYGKPVSESATPEGSPPVNQKTRIDQPAGKKPENTVAQAADALAASLAATPSAVSNSASSGTGRRIRFDAPATMEQLSDADKDRARTHGRPKRRYIDEPHGTNPSGPHFQISAPKRSNLTSITGQFLAYLGVLGLTIGTAIVIYGHFGGYSDYTPTGWLVTTVAQMLLFLGVINLVSGGIEQTNDDVSRRINSLGEQLMRIEQVTEEVLRGPKLPPRLYADPDAADADAEAVQRDTIPSR